MKKSMFLIGLIGLITLLTGCAKTDAVCFTVAKNTIIKYDKACGEKVYIPKQINGVSIEKIGNFAFMDMNLTKVKLPDTIKVIGIGAFEKNSLTKIELPDSLTEIGANAFWQNKLTKLDIPSSVTKIGARAFNDNLLNAEDAFIYGYTNQKIDQTILISYGGRERKLVLPSNIKVLERDSLAYNHLETVNLNKVKQIKLMALSNNNIKNITIPATVEKIEPLILQNNPVNTITILGKKDLSAFSRGLKIDMVGKTNENTTGEVKYIFK